MSSNPLSHLMTMNQCALAMAQQLAEAGGASLGELAAQWPAGQEQLAQWAKSSLAVGQEWKTLQAGTFVKLLQLQLAAIKPQQSKAMHEVMELHETVGNDLAAQHKAALKEAAERLNLCMDDLRKARSGEDISLVLSCYFSDVGNKLRENAEQSLTLLTSATAAASVLTGRVLDGMIASS